MYFPLSYNGPPPGLRISSLLWWSPNNPIQGSKYIRDVGARHEHLHCSNVVTPRNGRVARDVYFLGSGRVLRTFCASMVPMDVETMLSILGSSKLALVFFLLPLHYLTLPIASMTINDEIVEFLKVPSQDPITSFVNEESLLHSTVL